MAAGRLREAMADVAETLRRVFRDPPTHALDPALAPPVSRTVPFPRTQARAGALAFAPATGEVPVLAAGLPGAVAFRWDGVLREEPGLAQWDAGARVCDLPLFRAGSAARLEVPPLPRVPAVRTEAPARYGTRSRGGLEAFPSLPTRQASCSLAAPRARRGLEAVLALPVAFQGEDIPSLSKALWMRYTLKLVKETGQNIRNLDVLGLYRIPAKGVRQVHHQAATGRLLVALGPEAEGSTLAPFVLARRKDDGSMVCCYVEEV